MIVDLISVSISIVLVYAMFKDIYNLYNQEEIYRMEYKEFMDDDTYFKVKYEEKH